MSPCLPLTFRRGCLAVAALGLSLWACAPRAARVQESATYVEDRVPVVDVLIVAPHPDDEAIMAAGVIAREAASGRRVAVLVVTNGDLSCERDGWRREDETVAAMAHLGVREQDIFFLGYPDGHLGELGEVPLPPLERRDGTGQCDVGNTTYAHRGHRKIDVHSWLTGQPARYLSESLTFDLASLLDRLRPHDVYVSHPIDEHPDHAFTYAYVRRALERSSLPAPRLHRALVHIGGCWPTAAGEPPCAEVRFAPSEDAPALPASLAAYAPLELLPVPASMLSSSRTANPKFQAIAEYASQTGSLFPNLSYLFSFVRAREPFFPEALERDVEGRLRRARTPLLGAVSSALEWQTSGRTSWREMVQKSPIRCIVRRAEEDSSFEVLRGARGEYVLRSTLGALILERWNERSEVRVLRRWVVPASSHKTAHTLEIDADVRPDDGGVSELTLRRDGEFFGLAVDPHPLFMGTSIAVSNAPPDQVNCQPY